MAAERSLKRLYAALSVLTLACVGLLAATKIDDPDTMQYLASGRAMLAGGLDYGCVFSYATNECQFVYSQWLFHLMTYGLYRAGSWTALVNFQIAVVVSVFAVIVMREWRRGTNPGVTAAVVLLAGMVARERFMLRADLFALLPAVVLYYVLETYFDSASTARSRRRLLLAVGLIQLLWANTHGSFLVGFLLLGAFLIDAARTRSLGLRPMLEAAGVIGVASVVSPFGLKAFLQPLRFMLAGEQIAPQLEFLSPFAPADLEHLTVTSYKLLLIVTVALLVVSFRAIRLRDVLVLAPSLYLSVKGMRYLALFAIVAAIILPSYGEHLRARLARRMSHKGSARSSIAIAGTLVALLIMSIAGIAYGAATDRIYRFDAISRRTGWGVSDLVYPKAATDFFLRNELPGNTFNDYSIGTYLNWRLSPARKTFIDGHSYTIDSLAYYRQIMAGGIAYRDVADRFGIQTFFLGHKSSEARPLIARLYRDEQWALVYFDELAAIFLRRSPENEGTISRLRVDLSTRAGGTSAPLVNVLDPADSYLGHTNRGIALSELGQAANAAADLALAAKENSSSFVTWTALGNILDMRGESVNAQSAYEQAVEARPGYAPGHFWLGVSYLRSKRTDDGIAHLRRALAINRRFPLAHYNLGAAFENRGDRMRAREEYRKELEINPSYQPAQKALRRLG